MLHSCVRLFAISTLFSLLLEQSGVRVSQSYKMDRSRAPSHTTAAMPMLGQTGVMAIFLTGLISCTQVPPWNSGPA